MENICRFMSCFQAEDISTEKCDVTVQTIAASPQESRRVHSDGRWDDNSKKTGQHLLSETGAFKAHTPVPGLSSAVQGPAR